MQIRACAYFAIDDSNGKILLVSRLSALRAQLVRDNFPVFQCWSLEEILDLMPS